MGWLCLVVADDTDRTGGMVVERLRERGADLRHLDRDALGGARVGDASLVLLLGSERTAHDPAETSEPHETALVREALAEGVAVWGICYGAQIIARALGGSSRRGAEPEFGWHLVESFDDDLCPPGPWAQMHHDVVDVPPGARVLGRTARATQGFVDTAHGAVAIGWQFHPEVDADTYLRWVREESSACRAAGVDPDALALEVPSLVATTRPRTRSLVDAALLASGLA